jgi:hypothetical protein
LNLWQQHNKQHRQQAQTIGIQHLTSNSC